jgi:hypothetical protein
LTSSSPSRTMSMKSINRQLVFRLCFGSNNKHKWFPR